MVEHSNQPAPPTDQSGTAAPSPLSRLLANVPTLVVATCMFAGIWWWMVGALQSPSTPPTEPTQSTTANKPPHFPATNGNGNDKPPASSETSAETSAEDTTTDSDDPVFDPKPTSRQNPFFQSHWKATHWKFTRQAMQSSTAPASIATFRRRYRKLTIECRLAPVDEPGEFQIALFAPETDALMRAEFSRTQVRLTAKINGTETVIKRRNFAVSFNEVKPTSLRLTATGNRVLIVCDGKVVLNGSQPAAQSGKPLELSLRSVGGAFRISDLRLEGE